MRLEAVLFDSNEQYRRMARVLAASAAENSPATPLEIHRITGADSELTARPDCKRTWIDNARKAKHHNRIIQQAEDGAVLGMLDSDCMVLGDLSEISDMEFDIAYTERPPGSKWRINTGVYFVRVSAAVREYCQLWFEKAREMLGNRGLHDEWKSKYGGIHQSAFGWMIERSGISRNLLSLPCETWNCVNGCYTKAENPKVVHLMRYSMRKWCFGECRPPGENERRLAERWQAYDARGTG